MRFNDFLRRLNRPELDVSMPISSDDVARRLAGLESRLGIAKAKEGKDSNGEKND